jgi:hypothetical protein
MIVMAITDVLRGTRERSTGILCLIPLLRSRRLVLVRTILSGILGHAGTPGEPRRELVARRPCRNGSRAGKARPGLRATRHRCHCCQRPLVAGLYVGRSFVWLNRDVAGRHLRWAGARRPGLRARPADRRTPVRRDTDAELMQLFHVHTLADLSRRRFRAVCGSRSGVPRSTDGWTDVVAVPAPGCLYAEVMSR